MIERWLAWFYIVSTSSLLFYAIMSAFRYVALVNELDRAHRAMLRGHVARIARADRWRAYNATVDGIVAGIFKASACVCEAVGAYASTWD